MSKYGFDFFLEQMDVIEEMARPAVLFADIDPALNNTYAGLMKYLAGRDPERPREQRFGGVNDTKRPKIVSAFIISSIIDFSDKYNTTEVNVIDGEEVEEDVPMTSQELTREITGGTTNDNFKQAARVVTQDNLDVVQSDAFKNFVNDISNLEQFIEYGGGTAKRSNRRIGASNMIKNVTGGEEGLEIGDYESLQAEMLPLERKIRAIMKKGDYTPSSSEGVSDEKIHESFVSILGDILDQNFNSKTGNSTDNTVLEKIYDLFEKLLDEGTYKSKEQIQSFIEKTKGKGQISDSLHRILLDALEQSESYSADGVDETQMYDFGEYDPNVVKQVLGDDPKRLEKFHRWITAHREVESDKVARRRTDLRELRRANKERRMQEIEDAKSDKERELDQLQQQVRDPEIPASQRRAIRMKMDQLQKEVDQEKRQQPVTEGVMSYFSEQVKKDNLLGGPRGEFKDKGYKRFRNTFEWWEYNS